MKKFLLLACAAIGLSMVASASMADDGNYNNNGYNNGYNDGYNDNRNNWQYQNNGNYSDNSQQPDWNNGGYNHRHDTVSPRSVVRNLQRSDYRNISQPLLSGRFYQVKAISPRGHHVKLYIDRYSGQIVKVKS